MLASDWWISPPLTPASDVIPPCTFFAGLMLSTLRWYPGEKWPSAAVTKYRRMTRNTQRPVTTRAGVMTLVRTMSNDCNEQWVMTDGLENMQQHFHWWSVWVSSGTNPTSKSTSAPGLTWPDARNCGNFGKSWIPSWLWILFLVTACHHVPILCSDGPSWSHFNTFYVANKSQHNAMRSAPVSVFR